MNYSSRLAVTIKTVAAVLICALKASRNVTYLTLTYNHVWSSAGTRTCSATHSDRACSLWEASHLLSEQFSNKCKTQKGLFGIINGKLGLPFSGIFWNWTQTGIYFSDPREPYVSGEKRAVAEVEDYFSFIYSAWIYSYCIYYQVNYYCIKCKVKVVIVVHIVH